MLRAFNPYMLSAVLPSCPKVCRVKLALSVPVRWLHYAAHMVYVLFVEVPLDYLYPSVWFEL